MKPPSPKTTQAAPPRPTPSYVEDAPFLDDPTAEPDQPITAGLPSGPGPGPEALQSRVPTTNQRILKYLPEFERIAADPDTPDTFRALVTYLAGER